MSKKTVDTGKNKAKDIVFISLFSVLLAVCSWISIPTVVPFTMQTFAVYLSLYYLGGKKGTASIIVYLLLGLIGLPVFSNGTAGFGVLIGANGGYMIGWIAAGLIVWLFDKILGKNIIVKTISGLIGLIVCYTLGTAWFMVVYDNTNGNIGFWTALGSCVIPFIIPDLIKLGFALWVGKKLKKITSKP